MSKFTPREKQKIKARAMKAIGKDSADDKYDFMEECISELGDPDLCELLWEEQGGD